MLYSRAACSFCGGLLVDVELENVLCGELRQDGGARQPAWQAKFNGWCPACGTRVYGTACGPLHGAEPEKVPTNTVDPWAKVDPKVKDLLLLVADCCEITPEDLTTPPVEQEPEFVPTVPVVEARKQPLAVTVALNGIADVNFDVDKIVKALRLSVEHTDLKLNSHTPKEPDGDA